MKYADLTACPFASIPTTFLPTFTSGTQVLTQRSKSEAAASGLIDCRRA